MENETSQYENTRPRYDKRTIVLFAVGIALAVIMALLIAVPVTYSVALQLGKEIMQKELSGNGGGTGGGGTGGGGTGGGGTGGGGTGGGGTGGGDTGGGDTGGGDTGGGDTGGGDAGGGDTGGGDTGGGDTGDGDTGGGDTGDGDTGGGDTGGGDTGGGDTGDGDAGDGDAGGGDTGGGDTGGGDTGDGDTGGDDTGIIIPPGPQWMPSLFDTGKGRAWPKNVFAPFVDITAWTSGEYGNNGALNLAKVKADTGIQFYNLGFIASANSGLGILEVNKKKIINWAFGGFPTLSEHNSDGFQYLGIKKTIKDLRAVGGDVTISIGGLNGEHFFSVTDDATIFENTYRDIIYGFGLTRLDLDIEGGAQNRAYHIASAKALKNIQAVFPELEIVLTLPVMDTGLMSIAQDVVKTYLEFGVDIDLINIMTMCYGSSAGDYADASIRAIDNTMANIKDMWKKSANITLTDAQAYNKIGFTISIGFETDLHPIFTVEMTEKVVKHAKSQGVNMATIWCLNRDVMTQSNSGIYGKYEHTNVYKKYYQY